MKAGQVYLAGAGPGDLGLVTLRTRELIQGADLIIYDYLCNPALLAWARDDAEKIYAGKSGGNHTLTQDQINALLIEKARSGLSVLRLKGGDPYIFGRGGEEAQELARAGIKFEVVPGISSAVAAPAYAGIPVTHRDCASTVTFVTGHEDPEKEKSSLDWNHLAGLRGTKVFLMGVERIGVIARRLIEEGMEASTPVALVRWGTTPRQETLVGTLDTIADLVSKKEFKAPAVIIVGEVVKLRTELNWFEQRPLLGRRIVVTRTRRQASGLVEKLTRLGADVLEIPTIRIVPLALSGGAGAQLKNIATSFDWLVFASPNAVERFFDEFFRLNKDVRALGAIKIAAVGPATAAKVRAQRLNIDTQPAVYTAEELGRCFDGARAKGQRFCLPQGSLAEPGLASHLQSVGAAAVEKWTLYDTILEPDDQGGARARYQQEGADFITFTSSSTAENWQALNLRPISGRPLPRPVSLGPVTSATLCRLGYENVVEADEATIDSLVETILHLI